MSPQFIISVVVTVVMVFMVMLPGCAYLILLERKVAAWVQDRIGPNRTNFSFGLIPFKSRHLGLGQALADGLKLLIKEDYTPPGVDRALFLLAPVLVIVPAMLGWAVIPWGGWMDCNGWRWKPWVPLIGGDVVEPFRVLIAAAPINIGVVYMLAIGSLAVYGVVIGGYASNNKYSFLGGLRATAQMLSYEIPQGLCVLIMILVSGTAATHMIVDLQSGGVWNILPHWLLAVIFFVCVLAECNRAPFDLAEAEQELVGGYHTEYSSMKWALFFLGEYFHMITGCGFFALLFLGGWSVSPFGWWPDLPLIGGPGIALIKIGVFLTKVLVLLFVMMWVRWTLPRFRFDQLMLLAWRGLIPLALFVLLADGVLVYLHATAWWHFFLANVAAGLGVLIIGPLLPQGVPPNRRVPLEGSRFCPPLPAARL